MIEDQIKRWDKQYESTGPPAEIQFQERVIRLEVPEGSYGDGWIMDCNTPEVITYYIQVLIIIILLYLIKMIASVHSSFSLMCVLIVFINIYIVILVYYFFQIDRIPCVVKVRWVGDGETGPTKFSYKIKFKGAVEGFNVIDVTSPRYVSKGTITMYPVSCLVM